MRAPAMSTSSPDISGAGSKQDKFDHALTAFAEAYADQTEADWHALVVSRRRTAPQPKTTASPAAK